MEIKIEDLVYTSIKTLNFDASNYFKSQQLNINEMNEFVKQITNLFGEPYEIPSWQWRWEEESWKKENLKCLKRKDILKTYHIYIRRHNCMEEAIVIDFNPPTLCNIIDFTLIMPGISKSITGCKHPNLRPVFIGPMSGMINYCPNCKEEIK